MSRDLRTALGAPDPAELVAAPAPAEIVVQRDALEEARSRAAAAVKADLDALVNTRELTLAGSMTTDRLAHLLAGVASAAATIDADYVRGWRDCARKARQALAPVISVQADPFKAADGSEDPS